jgi:hypothetical protein
MIRAPEIASVTMIQKIAYAYDQRGNILFLLPCDGILGYTGTSVTIRQGAHALTYNNMGSQTTMQTIRNH